MIKNYLTELLGMIWKITLKNWLNKVTTDDSNLQWTILANSEKKKHRSYKFQKIDFVSWLGFTLKIHIIFKGQFISECLFDFLNFPKNHQKIWQISALESKKWSNQKITSLYYIKLEKLRHQKVILKSSDLNLR